MDVEASGSRSQASSSPSCARRTTSLCVANKGLTKLLPVLPPDPSEVVSLDCSRNSFKYIDGLARLENVNEVIASHNKLIGFSSFCPVHRALTVLDVSYNEIADATHLCALQKLTLLDASHNSITGLPVMSKLIHLTCLNLASNKISSLACLRGLAKLVSLQTLNLNSNELTTLRNLGQHMPPKLKHLDVGANSLAELSEAFNLSELPSLISVVWIGNPCIPKVRPFDCRPFLFCCCPQTLKFVDERELSELEILKGELLLTKGKIRRFQNHAALCSNLAEECPVDIASPGSEANASFEKQVEKVIAKRREYLNSVNKPCCSQQSCSKSLPPSPYTQWVQQDPNATSISESFSDRLILDQKENRPPEPTPRPEIISCDESGIRRAVPSQSMSESTSRTPNVTQRPHRNFGNEAVQNSQMAVVPKSAPELLMREVEETPSRANYYRTHAKVERRVLLPVVDDIPADDRRYEYKGTFKLQAKRKHPRRVPNPRLQILERRLKICEENVKEMGKDIQELSMQNQQLTDTNEELTRIIEGLHETITALEAGVSKKFKRLIHFAVPVPASLRYERRSPTEVFLQWSHCSIIQPTGYGFSVNGDFIGRSRTIGNQTLISDLPPDKEASIRIHCYVDDIEGEKSLPIYIPPYKEVKMPDGNDEILEDENHAAKAENEEQVDATES